MSLEIDFPVEFLVQGVPIAYGASARSRDIWKSLIAQAAAQELSEGYWATEGPAGVTIFYFPVDIMRGDVDNIVKYILDALRGVIYLDDHQVERVLVQKFEPGRLLTLSNVTPRLAEALEGPRPVVYIRVDGGSPQGD